LARNDNPYSALPSTAFWRAGVADAGLFGLSGLWRSRWTLPADARFATFGSCFAQHISRALVARKLGWVDAEPAPRRTPAEIARAFNYGVFSARTGNVYTAAQLLWLVRMAAGVTDPDAAEVWDQDGRAYDSLRPAIEPDGFATAAEARLSRRSMIRSVRRAIAEADVFVFTLGLTEGWENAQTGQPYAMCPGTVAGRFDAATHVFCNYDYPRTRAALEEAWALMRGINPGLRLLLTVSPVPLTATASGQHVLVATTWSKSTLRAVAGDLAQAGADTDYFPSYEIITGAPTRSAFFEPNLRSVAPQGVEYVMGHFFAGLDLGGPPAHGATAAAESGAMAALERAMAVEDLVCEEMTLGQFDDN
jgi:GSCFA family